MREIRTNGQVILHCTYAMDQHGIREEEKREEHLLNSSFTFHFFLKKKL